ncbi:hypothetical protein M4I17_06600 [Enterococcus thailandicus]|uniref:hypothetical protein n=1 Tax=Enterococcus thailandicus TaxID=417368 RepID=UPI002542FD02|nr:hypothetical protein [Enterococcus thailandicus]MDK4352084.1 hypothetical protein [Enterococcus thailandicus]
MPTLKISDGKTTHTVSTKEEALHLIERYFGKEEDKNMKEILVKQINETYKSCLARKKNGWNTENLKVYKAGASNVLFNIINVLFNIINELETNELLTVDEVEELDMLMLNTLDTL